MERERGRIVNGHRQLGSSRRLKKGGQIHGHKTSVTRCGVLIVLSGLHGLTAFHGVRSLMGLTPYILKTSPKETADADHTAVGRVVCFLRGPTAMLPASSLTDLSVCIRVNGPLCVSLYSGSLINLKKIHFECRLSRYAQIDFNRAGRKRTERQPRA